MEEYIREFTIIGVYGNGETYIGWHDGKTPEEAASHVRINHEANGLTWPTSILAIFEGHLTDQLGN